MIEARMPKLGIADGDGPLPLNKCAVPKENILGP